MKKIKWILLLGLFIAVTGFAKPVSPVEAAYALIERVTPGYGDQFVLELISAQEGEDVYEITSKGGKVVLRGNNPVALATAFNQYLKYVCKVHISWLGDHLDLPEKLPLPSETVRNTIHGKYRVYMNYCTLSYSAAWWNWDRWQREIDYMAMNSINMPLSVVGLEAVCTIHFSNIGLRMRKPVLFLPHLRMQHGNGCRICKVMEVLCPNHGLISMWFWDNRSSDGSWNWE